MEVSVVPAAAGGLEELEGTVVVLDIIRASNTVLSLLAGGAGQVVIAADLELAYSLKRENPDWLLWGERGGIPPEGFDGDNSPSRAQRTALGGKSVILTTSAGTQAVHRLGRAGQVFFGSFANAAALTLALKAIGPSTVNLLAMGFRGREPAVEDDLCAEYLRASLLDRPPAYGPMRERILAGAGAELLRRLGLEEDLEFCTRLDSHTIVPQVFFEGLPTARAFSSPPG